MVVKQPPAADAAPIGLSGTLETIAANAKRVGGIIRMGYDECEIVTNDNWRQAAGGLPKHCFLVASGTALPAALTPDELVVLRVHEACDLPADGDVRKMRLDAMRAMATGKSNAGETQLLPAKEIFDELMRVEMQFSGLRATVLGRLNMEDGELVFHPALRDYHASSHYFVYKPIGAGLAAIVNLMRKLPTNKKERSPIVLGRVADGQGGLLDCKVNLRDFISMKTAILGMTRLGKSNTMKVIALETLRYAANSKQKVGQLLIDPMGEYSHPNEQDGTALGKVSGDVSIYSMRQKGFEGTELTAKPLQWNFFDEAQRESLWEMVGHELGMQTSNYVKAMLNSNFLGDSDPKSRTTAKQLQSVLYASLIRAGFTVPSSWTCEFVINEDIREAVAAQLDSSDEDASLVKKLGGTKLKLKPDELERFWTVAADIVINGPKPVEDKEGKGKEAPKPKKLKEPNADLRAFLDFYLQSRGRAGVTLLRRIKAYHDPDSSHDFRQGAIEELHDGKLVIVDLSGGDTDQAQVVVEMLLKRLIDTSQEIFVKGKDPPLIQIFLEEAHKLFDRSGDLAKRLPNNAYFRLAKEAAKLKLGLIYATQEPSQVDPIVRNNTANWIITRLNNTEETGVVAKYEEFAAFKDAIQRIEEVGFAHVKTASSPFTLPMQILKFDLEMLEQASKEIEGNKEGKP